MKHFRYIIILGTFFCLLSSCKKQSSKNLDDEITFNNISRTGENGIPLAEPDSDDWIFHASKDTEQEIFYSLANTTYNCQSISDSLISIGPAYPNPCINYFTLYINNPSQAAIDIRLVDKEFKVIKSIDSTRNNSIIFDVTTFAKNNIHRVYYRVKVKDCFWIGYGDVLIN